MRLTPPVGYAIAEIEKAQAKPFVTTVIRRGILQETVLNLKKAGATQKTSIGFGHLCSDD